MTWILFLLCLAIAGRELYLAFDRKRPAGNAPELDDIRTRLTALHEAREELEQVRSVQREQAVQTERLGSAQAEQSESLGETDARIRSLIAQINERMLPEVNTRLSQQRETVDHLTTEVAQLRDHLIGRLDQAVAASLGSEPVDTVAGALGGALDGTLGGATTADQVGGARDDLAYAYELFAGRYGMRVELTDPAAYKMSPGHEPDSAQLRYYLSGRSPRGLERDFIDLLHKLGTPCEDNPSTEIEAARVLLDALRHLDQGGAQIGPLVITRTPDSLLCGVLPLAELLKTEPAALIADPLNTTARLRQLPKGRLYDATTHSAR